MPRKPNIRARTENSQASDRNHERYIWLSHWKEEAVKALPSSAPVDARVWLREAVEEALVRFVPENSSQEIHDIITALASQAAYQLEQEKADQQRQTRKIKLLEFAETILSFAIAQFPLDLVGSPNSS